MKFRHPFISILIFTAFITSAFAKNQVSDFTGSVGGGLSIFPTYPGANTYEYLPLPLVDVVYKQVLFAAVTGVGAQFRYDDWVFGPRLTYNTGRPSSGYVKNMDDLPGSIDGGAFVKYLTLPWVWTLDLQTAITQAGHQGAYGDIGLLYRIEVDTYWTMVSTFSLMYGSQSYMNAFFGVSDSEAKATGFAEYKPQWGLYSAGYTLALANSYFDPWRFFGTAGVLTLGTQPGQSDVVQDQIQWSFFAGVAYHFQ